MMVRPRIKALAGLLAAVGVVTLPGTGTADAGTNGQQVYFWNTSSTEVCVYGVNQNGQPAGVCGPVTHTYVDQYLGNWWWVGSVTIVGNNGNEIQCDVAENDPWSDWKYCGAL
jgi:hypothetical protein